MLKKSLLLAVTLLASCAMSFAQTRYVVWSGDELTADETQIPALEWQSWWGLDFNVADDASAPEGKVRKFVSTFDGTCSMGVYQNNDQFDNKVLSEMDLVFMAKAEGSGNWSVRLTATNADGEKLTPENDAKFAVPADGEFHEVRLNIKKDFADVYGLWQNNPKGYVFSLIVENPQNAVLSVCNIRYEAAIEMPEITAEAANITATSADLTYAVSFPDGYTNTKVTVNGEAAQPAATLNLTDLTPKTAYTYVIVAEGEIGGNTYKTEKVVSFSTLREVGDVSMYYGFIDGKGTQAGNTFNVFVEYSIAYNSDKTITIVATFDGLPADSNHKVNLQNGDNLDNWKMMTLVADDTYTYTSVGTFEEGALINMFFWCEYANGVFGGDYHILYNAGSENEKPSAAPRVKASAQNVTYNSAEIAYTLIPETMENATVKVYYKPLEGDAVEATSNPIVLSDLTEMTAYAYEVYAVAEIDLNGDGVITADEILESAHAKVEFKTPSETARDIVYAEWANVEFKTNPVVYASLPWQVTYKADGTALYEIDLSQVEGKVPGLVPQIYWNGFKSLSKNAETGWYEYDFGAQEADATTAISHYLAYAGGTFDSRSPYTAWGMENERPQLGEATSLKIAASKTSVKADEEASLSVVAKDAAGHYLPVNDVTITVSPETAKVENFVFTSSVKGKYEITATSGAMSDKTTITVYASAQAVDVAPGLVGVTNTENLMEGSKVENANDGNEGSELRWDCSTTEEHYLIYDLAKENIPGYNIEAVDILFEGAYATEFTVTLTNNRPEELGTVVAAYAAESGAATQDVVFTPAANGTRHIFVNEPDGYHRYVALRTTKALNSGWGIKVKEVKLYGTPGSAGTPSGIEDLTEDAAAPVEYYNLNGIRVANPENGLYIRRAGSKVEKVFIR